MDLLARYRPPTAAELMAKYLPSAGPAAANLPTVPEEPDAGILSGLMSGIQYAGESIEKPGVALTGLLAGEPSALLNLIPFSDTLGITDPKDRIYTRDMLARWGMAPPNEPGFGANGFDPGEAAWDVAGFAGDVIVNPLNLLGFGGLTGKAAKVAQPALETLRGVTGAAEAAPGAVGAAVEAAKTAGELGHVVKGAAVTPLEAIKEVGRGERALVNLYSPTQVWPLSRITGASTEPVASFGTGETVAKVLDTLAFNPITKLPLKLFVSSAGNTAETTLQKVAMESKQQLHNELSHLYDVASVWGGAMRHLKGEFGKIAKWNSETGDPQAFESMMDLLMEPARAKKLSPEYIEDVMKRMTVEARDADLPASVAAQTAVPQVAADTAKRIQAIAQEYYGVLDTMVDTMDQAWHRVQNLGLKAEDLDDLFVPHAARRVAGGTLREGSTPDTMRVLSTYFPWASRRNFVLRDVPEGTYMVNRIARDSLVAASKDVDQDTLRAALTKQLTELGVRPTADAEILDLQKMYVRKKYLEPALHRSGIAPTDERWIKTIQGELATVGKPLDDGMVRLYSAGPGLRFTRDLHEAALQAAKTKSDLKFLDVPEAQALASQMPGTPDVFSIAPALGNTAQKATLRLPDETYDALSKVFGHDAKSFQLEGVRGASKAEQLVRYFRGQSPELLTKGLFNRETVTDWTDYMERLAGVESNLLTMRNFLNGVARVEGMAPKAAKLGEAVNPTGRTLAQTGSRWLSDLGPQARGVGPTGPVNLPVYEKLDLSKLSEETLVPLSMAWEATGLSDEGLKNFAMTWAERNGIKFNLDDYDIGNLIRSIGVPPEAVKTIAAYTEVMKPKMQGELGRTFDKLQSMWKGWVTATPSFHTRNMTAGQFANMVIGAFNPKHVATAIKFLAGKGDLPLADEIKTMAQPMLRRGNRIVDTMGEVASIKGEQEGVEGIGTALFQPFRDLRNAMMGKRYSDVAQAFNPTAMRGAYTGKGENLFSKLGGAAYELVEFLNKVPAYLSLRLDKGLTPGEALHQIKLAHYDYSDLTKFEKDYMRRLLPFYGWTRKNIPYQLHQIITNPAGRTGATLRAMHSMQGGGEEGYTPAWLRETSMVPLPGGTPEATTFLRGFGLPLEDLRNVVMTNAGPLKSVPGYRTLERFGAMMTPALKIPAEYFAQKSMYTGRPMQYMKPITGSQPVDTLLFRSGPWGPLVSRAEAFAEESLPVALAEFLTGIKGGVVDLEKWKLIEQKQRESDLLEATPGVRKFQNYYVPADAKATTDPDTLARLARLQRLNKAITELMTKRKDLK